MTATTDTTGTAGLAQVAPGVLARLRDAKPWTVAEMAELMAAPAAELPEAEPFPAPAEPVTFTDKLRSALRGLPGLFGQVAPTERRKLEAAELVRLTDEIIAIDELSKQLGDRKNAIQEYVRTHMDFAAEAQGLTPLCDRIAEGVAKGHYLVASPGTPYEVPVEGYSDAWQQRFVKGKVAQDLHTLVELREAGTITQPEFNAFTREVRVLDEDKIKVFIKKAPRRGLAILAAITKRNAPGASVNHPKK
jgi:hypothetical protein